MRYQAGPVFEFMDENAQLWRYVDFAKFVALLQTSGLFFARADRLGDRFEGALTRSAAASRDAWVEAERTKSGDFHADFLAGATKEMREYIYVNCWNHDAHESAALWRMYAPPEGGVAIRSTFGRLTSSFVEHDVPTELELAEGEKPPPLWAGPVRYIDPDVDDVAWDTLTPRFVAKRRSFEFEHEVRALFVAQPKRFGPGISRPDGHLVKVDLDVLVDSIVVSPVAPTWFASLVVAVCQRYGLDKPVTTSRLADRAMY